jgi:hypothetical protein
MAQMQIRGTQIISGTITDTQIAAAAAIATSKLAEGSLFIKSNGTVPMAAALAMGGYKITGMADPSASTDGATKNYVDAQVVAAQQGLSPKAPCQYGTTANITLSGLNTQAGGEWTATLAGTERIAVLNQTAATQNGIYTPSSGAWTRVADFNTASNIIPNSYFWVEMGSTLADTGWVLTADPSIVVGTTNLNFVQFNGAGTITAGNGISKTGNTLAVKLGNGLGFDGSNNVQAVAADTTLNVSASGIKLAALNSAYLLVGNASNVATGVALSGDATLSNAGVLTLAATVMKTTNFVSNEVPSGTINGSNTAFTLANTPVSGTVQLYLNGVRLQPGAGNDYTLSGLTITMLYAPATGDQLLADYRK